MATALAAFTPYIAPAVPGCPEPLIDDAVRQAAIEFCERTEALRERLSFNTVIAQDYVVMAPLGGDVARVYRVSVVNADTRLERSRREDYDEDGSPGQPTEYYVENLNTMRFYPVPDAVYPVVVNAVVKPARDATTLDDLLFSAYRDAIAAGARKRLMGMSSQPWTNTSQAAIEGEIFNDAIDTIRMRKATGGTNAPLRTRGHYF